MLAQIPSLQGCSGDADCADGQACVTGALTPSLLEQIVRATVKKK